MFGGANNVNDAVKLSVAAALGGIDPYQATDPQRSLGLRAAAIRNQRAAAEANPDGTPVPQTARYIPGAQLTLNPSNYFTAIYGEGQPAAEDLSDPDQFDAAVKRIEQGVALMAEQYAPVPSVVDSALTLAFDSRRNRARKGPNSLNPPEGQDVRPPKRRGDELYTLTRGQQGEVSFAFTDAGRAELRRVLVEQQRGATIARRLHEERTGGNGTRPSAFIPQTENITPQPDNAQARKPQRYRRRTDIQM
jgi:hypothetical protein